MALINNVRDEEERKRRLQEQARQTAESAAKKAAQQNVEAARRNSAGAAKPPEQSAAETIESAKQKAASGNLTKTPKQHVDYSKYVQKSNPVRQTFNYETLGTQERVMQVARQMVIPEERQQFLQGWANYTQSDAYKAKQKRSAAMNSLSGLYDANGKLININTASYSQVVQGIRSIADSDKRNAAIESLTELTKTEGSRFYGQTIDKALLKTYLGNPDFGQDTYDDEVAAFEDAFYPQAGYEKENQSQYFSFVSDIRNGGYSESVQRQLIEKLDETYVNATGKAVPDAKEIADAKGTNGETGETASEGEGKPGFMEQLGDALNDVLGMFGVGEDAREPNRPDAYKETGSEDKSLSEKVIESVVDPEWLEKYREEQGPKQEGEVNRPHLISDLPEGVTHVGDYASAGRSDGPAIVKPSAKDENAPPSFEEWVEAGKPRASTLPVTYNVKDDSDVLKAMFEGKLSLVDPEQARAVVTMSEAPTVKKLYKAIVNEQAYDLNMSTIGATAHNALMAIEDENYPVDLRYDAYLILSQLAYEADQLEMDGKLPEGKGPALERYLKSDDDAMARLNQIRETKKAFEDDRAAQLAQQEELKKQALEQAREAVKTGEASEEQIAIVRENAPDYDLKTLKRVDKGFKARYDDVYSWDDGYFAYGEGTGFEASSTYRSMVNDKGITDDSDLRYRLSEGMCALMEEDAEAAHSLGMSLEDYYDSIGGMSNDMLCQRAATRMSQQGAKITDEEMQMLSVETGGDGVGWKAAGSLGVVHGGTSLYASFANTLYISSSESTVRLTAERMKQEHQDTYGVLGRDMYRAELTALINSGKLDAGYAKALGEAMRTADDIYDVGIDPAANGGILDSYAKATDNVKLVETYITENGTESEQYWFSQISGMTRNAAQAGIAAAATIATANPKLGFAIGYSSAEWGDNVSARWQQGYGRETGKLLGTIDTAGSYMANVMTFEGIMGRATGANTLFQKAVGKIMRGNPSGATKALAATKGYALKLAGLNAAAALGENILDEAVMDESKEKLTALFIEKAAVPLFKALESGKELGATDTISTLLGGVMETIKGVPGVAKEVWAGFGDAAIATSIFAVAGAAGAGVNTYKGTQKAADIAQKARPDDLIQYSSVQMALDIANGNSVDIEGFIEAFNLDSKNEGFITKFNAAAKQTKVDSVVAQAIATDDGSDGMLPKVKEANEQIASHEAAAKASRTAMQQAQDVLADSQTKIDAGTADDIDVQNAANAAMAYAKNKTGYDEHTREAMQKKEQVKAVLDEKMAGTRMNAWRQVEAEQFEAQSAIAQSSEVASARINAQIAEVEAEIETAMASLDDAVQMGFDEDTLAALGQRLVDLEDKKSSLLGDTAAELEAEAEPTLAEAEPERTEYEAFQQKQAAQLEADEMKPVYSKLASTRIYVDESQRANILSATGLKTLGQVSRKYGLRLTSDKSKGAVSLDGSFFADLAELAPGRIDAQAAHPEEALVALVERKKQLKGMQASVGETAYEKYLPDGAFYATQDPVMQQTASEIYKRTGVEVVVAPLANNIRALYDRANGRIILSSRIGAGEVMRKAVMHELTHYIEGSAGYDAYKNAVLGAAYLNDTDGNLRAADEARIQEVYAGSGVELDEDGLSKELVAEATEKIVNDPDGRIVQRLLDSGKRGVLSRVWMKLTQFLARHKAKKSGKLDAYDAMRNARQKLTEALRSAGKWAADAAAEADPTIDLDTAGRRRGEMAYGAQGEQMQFSLVDVGEMGKGVYESNFAPDTPKDEKRKRVIDLWQNVWSQKPIELNIKENGETRAITASFDPDYDPENIRRTDLGKMMHSKNGSGGDRNVTLNLADDLYDIARTADYHSSEGEQGKTTETHKGVKVWHYFFNDIIYRDGENETPYTVWMDVKEKDDGGYVYQLYARKTKKKALPNLSREIGPGDQAATPSDISIADADTNVNTQSMQNDVQYALAPNQFANETAQRLNTLSEETKAVLAGRGHEAMADTARMDAAWQAVNTRGRDAVMDELLDKPVTEWTAQDNVNAALLGVLAESDGDLSASVKILMKYDEAGTSAGQTMRARQIIQRMSPAGVIAETLRSANRTNAQKGIPANSFPVDEEAPKTKVDMTDEKGVVHKTPDKVAEVYDEANALMRQLEGLSGEVSYDNPWGLPLSDKQMALIRAYKLEGQKLPGTGYNTATLHQRMLAAILAVNNEVQGSGLETVAQQLAAMQKGYAVVTAADVHYIQSQISEFKAIEGTNATEAISQAGKNALGRAWQAQDNVNTDGALSQWSKLRYANMLSSPATAVRNVMSNVLNTGLEGAATRLAAGIDKAVAKKTGTRTVDVATKEERKAGRTAFSEEIAQTMTDYFVTHTDTGHGRKYGPSHTGRVFQNEFLEGYRNLVDFAMQIGDRPFYEQCYAEELAIIKRLGMKKTEMKGNTKITRPMTEAEMKEEATVRATKRVFQEDTFITKWINQAKQDPTADLILSTLIPFVKTPTNVAMRAVDYSPVGFAITLARRGFGGIDTGKTFSISQRDYVMNMGRGLTGTGLMLAGWALAAAGLIGYGRGEEENTKRRNVLSTLGEPYSMYINIGGTKHEIDWALPMAAAIAAGADLMKRMDDGEGLGEAFFSAIISGVGDQLFSTPMLSSLQEIFQGYDDTTDTLTRVFSTGVTSLMNQTFSPALIRAIAKYTDPYVRDTSDQNPVWAAVKQNVVQYWPVVRGLLPAATDLTGDAMLQSGYWNYGKEHANAALHFLDSFFTPTATIGTKNDEALWELLDLSYRVNDTGCLPAALVSKNSYSLTLNKTTAKKMSGFAQYKESGVTMELTDDEKRQANADYGNLLFNGDGGRGYRDAGGKTTRFPGLRAVMEDKARYGDQEKAWSELNEEERADLAADMVSDAKTLIIMDVARRKKKDGEL